MTDASMAQPKAALGIGAIISDSFSILFGKIIQVVLIAFIPGLIGFLLTAAYNGFDVTLGQVEPDFSDPGAAGIGTAISFVVNMVVYSITTALLVQLAYDAKLSRPVQIGRYIGPALSSVLPLAILTIAVGILFVIGFVLFIVPGLWVYAVFSVVAPVIVIEGAGFGGLGRSAALTKEYRWPIVGALILAMIITMILQALAMVVVGLIAMAGTLGMVLAVILLVAISSLGAGFLAIMVSLIYARLREIKEGISVDQIASVFD